MIPRPQFFLVRPDSEVLRNDTGTVQRGQGPVVPLIAVDELPDWIDIGLPRELTVEQTMGLYNLGTVPQTGDTYRVRIIEPNSQEEFVWTRDSSSKVTLVPSGICAPGQRTMAHPEQNSQRVPYNAPAAPPAGRDHHASAHPSSSSAVSSPHNAHPKMAAASPSNLNRLTHAEGESMLGMQWADLVERSIARDTEARPQDTRHHHPNLLVPPPSPQIAPSHPTVHRDAIMSAEYQWVNPIVSSSTMTTPPKPAANNNDVATTAASTASTASTVTANPAPTGASHSNTTSAAAASSSAPAPAPQEYCRHWCQHGTCKWGTFCRHKHAMPITLEGLLEVGLCEIPAWWIAATGIGMSTSKTKQTAAAAGTSPINSSATGDNGGNGGTPSAPAPVPCTPMAHNLPQMLPAALMGSGVGASAKKLSNRKLKAQQREFNQRLRLLSSMLILPGGYGSSSNPHYPLRHPADALLMHGLSSGQGHGQQHQQMQLERKIQLLQQQQRQLERERKGEKTPLDRSRKNVKVTFNEDGTVSLVTDALNKGVTKGGSGAGAAGGEASTAGTAAVSTPVGASPSSAAVSNAETGNSAAGAGASVTDEADKKGRENEGSNKEMMKPVKGLAASMHAPPKQDHQQGNVNMRKATCEDERDIGNGSAVQQQVSDVPLLVEI